MKLSVSAYRAQASAHKKILSQSQFNYGSTAAASSSSSAPSNLVPIDIENPPNFFPHNRDRDSVILDLENSQFDDNNTDNRNSTKEEQNYAGNPNTRSKSNQRWMKLRTTVQISSAIQSKKPPLKREDSFLKRFSTRQIPESQETLEDSTAENSTTGKPTRRRRKYFQKHHLVVNPDENFYFYWLMMITCCVLYNLWTLIVRQSFPELQNLIPRGWLALDCFTDLVFIFDIVVQLRTGYLEQGLMVYDGRKLACHYAHSTDFIFDTLALMPLDLLQIKFGFQPLVRFPRFLKAYRSIRFYYIVESRTVWPNLWRVVNLIHILLILAHWFGCFYYLLSEAEGFQGDWVYPYRPGDYATLTRKYLGSLYWSTLTLTTIGDLPTPETNAELTNSVDGPRPLPRRGIKSRLLIFASSYGYIFTIVSYLIGVFIFATIVGQVGNVITNRNANRLEFERLLDGAKTYMRHHKVPGGMKRRVLRWYDYSWSRGRIQGGGDINTALGLLPDKLKTELALHVNLSVLKKVTIFQECQPEFLHDLVLKMKAYIFTPGDSICRKGEVAREMFIIADGILEVISETGRVLTTMKAGDFFGEIGILNLDGLNKRTADVRSVGYSELFSLSREDVLAAMKDYPEAQAILQTLGRKRLMEVRGVNKKHAEELEHKKAEKEESAASAAKLLVEKIKNEDIKGKLKNIKGVLKKSGRGTETVEMKPLFTSIPENGTNTSRGFLKRMSQVKSIETKEVEEKNTAKAPSPIGAGLPLLQRLKLLKEKQDREELIAQNKSIQIRKISRDIRDDISHKEDDSTRNDKVSSLSEISVDREKLAVGSLQSTSTSHLININDALNVDLNHPPRKVSFSKMDNDSATIPEQPEIPESNANINLSEPSTKQPISSTLLTKKLTANKSPWSKINTVLAPTFTAKNTKINNENNLLDNKIPIIEAKPNVIITEETIDDSESNVKINKNINHNNSYNNNDKNNSSNNSSSRSSASNNTISNQNSKPLSADQNKLSIPSESTITMKIPIIEFNKNLSQTQSLEYESTSKFKLNKFNSRRSRSETSVTELKNLLNPYNDVPSDFPASPESNETFERRKLKILLKKMYLSKEYFRNNNPRKLLREPTLEGYLARHSKLIKSVTLDSTISSPPFLEKRERFFAERQKLSIKRNGSVDKRNEVQEAVNNMITKHIQEMYNFYQTKFHELQTEIEKRDRKINELEYKLSKSDNFSFENYPIQTQQSINSDNFQQCSRQDYIDHKTHKNADVKKNTSTYYPFKQFKNSSEQEYSNQEPTSVVYSSSGNLTDHEGSFNKISKNWSDDREIDIEETYESSSSTSTYESQQSNRNDNTAATNNKHSKTNDWEIRMLAAELDQRERKRGKSLSGNLIKRDSPMFRNDQNKLSDSDTEFSDTDVEKNTRPRAISLDQFNFGDRSSLLLKKMRLSKGRKRL